MTRRGRRWTPTERQSLRVAWYDEHWDIHDIAQAMRRDPSGIEHEAARLLLPPKTARFWGGAQRYAQRVR